jgi:hypothetical protein
VEALRESIDAEEQELDANLSLYAEQVHPDLERDTERQQNKVQLGPSWSSTTGLPG